MNDFSNALKTTRTKLGITQMELAAQAGVSLPSVQNIEAGKGNPSLDTLFKLGSVLGLELKIGIKEADWNLLASAGAALTPDKSIKRGTVTPGILVKTIRHACLELSTKAPVADRQRKSEALLGLLLALQSHFPTFFKKHFGRSELIRSFISNSDFSGKIIKLRRQSVAALAKYL